MMKASDLRNEEGQSLIQVALMLVVLIGFVGLAIDGGNLYAQRRRMQNAADAGALAGAWAMCRGESWVNAQAIAESHMGNNGATTRTATLSDGYKVTAVAGESVSPFLPFTFGGSINVGATAKAACGIANKACGIWPYGLEKSIWNTYKPLACPTDGSTPYKIAVWIKDSPGGGATAPETSCYRNGNHTTLRTDVCDCYQCTYGSNQFKLQYRNSAGTTYVNSTYLDFKFIPDLVTGTPESSNPGCGGDELGDNLGNTSSIQISVGQCVGELTGNKMDSAPFQKGLNTRRGQTFGLPVYENISPDDPCNKVSNSCGTIKKVTSFACATLSSFGTSAITTVQIAPYADAEVKKGSNFVKITKPARFDAFFLSISCDPNACQTSCGSTDGSPPAPSGVNAANLVQ